MTCPLCGISHGGHEVMMSTQLTALNNHAIAIYQEVKPLQRPGHAVALGQEVSADEYAEMARLFVLLLLQRGLTDWNHYSDSREMTELVRRSLPLKRIHNWDLIGTKQIDEIASRLFRYLENESWLRYY